MTAKCLNQPLCRACGNKISKWTEDLYVYAEPPRTHVPEMKLGTGENRFKDVPTGNMVPIHVSKHLVGTPRTKAEAQTLINQKIVSVRKNSSGVITRISVWDGETYRDAYFCKGTCAASYAYMIASSPSNQIQSVAYADALYLQRNGKPRT